MCIAVRQALVNTCCLVRTPANVSSAHVAAVLLGNQLMNNNSQQKSATMGGIGQQHPETLLGLGPTHEQQHLHYQNGFGLFIQTAAEQQQHQQQATSFEQHLSPSAGELAYIFSKKQINVMPCLQWSFLLLRVAI
jgi:hypothetical protein